MITARKSECAPIDGRKRMNEATRNCPGPDVPPPNGPDTISVKELSLHVHKLFAVRNELGGIFPDFKSGGTFFAEYEIGQAWAACLYNLRVWDASGWMDPNAQTYDGRLVQVWAESLPRGDWQVHRQAEHLLALQLSADGDPKEIYNGHTRRALDFDPTNARKSFYWPIRRDVTFADLKRLMSKVGPDEQLPQVQSFVGQDRRWRDFRTHKPLRQPRPSMIPILIRSLYAERDAFSRMFRQNTFKPVTVVPWHVARAWATYLYGLSARRSSSANAVTRNGQTVYVDSRSRHDETVLVRNNAEYLILLQMDGDGGDLEEIYNGPNRLAWLNARRAGNNFRPIKISKLRELMSQVPRNQRLPLLRPWPETR